MFEWDEGKRAQNLKKHGVDFEYAAMIFAGPYLDRVDDRRDYGEDRWIALGEFGGSVFVVTYTFRQNAIRIISAWQGGRKEHEQYQTYVLGGASGQA